MGLSMTLTKTQNHMYEDYLEAYWVITDIGYSTDMVSGNLVCYPSRECSKKNGTDVTDWQSISFGSPTFTTYKCDLWHWTFMERIEVIFPNGIPLSVDAQKSAIYNWIKDYTKLPFKDVFEN